MTLDHASVQVASPAGRDLLDRKMKSLQPVGIVFRLNIARQHGHTVLPRQGFESALQKTGLARAGRTDQVQAQNAVLLKPGPQLSRDAVIFTEDFLLQRYSLHILLPPDKPIPTRLHRCMWFPGLRIADSGNRSRAR